MAVPKAKTHKFHLNFQNFQRTDPPCMRIKSVNYHSNGRVSDRLNYRLQFGKRQNFLNHTKRSIPTASSSSFTVSVATAPENTLQDFLGWAIANGIEGLDGDKSKIGLFVGNNNERGIAATAPIRRNETFSKIPLRLAITDDPDDGESNTLVGKDAPWSVRLACKLLRLKSQGPASPWYPYLNSLPTAVPAPLLNFSWEDVQSIAYEPARRQFEKTAWIVSSAWTSLPPGAASVGTEQQLPSREEFDWAISVVHSRTFGTAGKGGGVGVRMLVPLVDMLNHSGDRDLSTTSNASSNSKGGGSQEPVPTATDNVRWDVVSKIGGEFFMVLTATRDIQQGEELLLSYGERNNDDFFLHYGFIPARNPHDDVILFTSIEEGIDYYLEKYIPLGKLPPNQLQEAITTAYTAATKEETGDGGAAMEAALAAMPEAEADHIRQERSAIKLLSKGRTDGRLVAAIESLHSTARIAGNADVAVNCQDHVREVVAARAAEVLRNMYITAKMKLEDDLQVLASGESGDDDDEHNFKSLAKYYTTAIATSPWKDIIYSESTSDSTSSTSTTAAPLIDAGGGSGEDAALLAALQAAAPAPSASSSASSSSSVKKSTFVDIEPTSGSTSDSTSTEAVHPLVRQYRAYKAMICWDALLC
jgi:hypothetical protein